MLHWLKEQKIKSSTLWHSMLSDSQLRVFVLYQWLTGLMSAVCFLMSVLNLFTGEYLLMAATLSASVLFAFNAVACARRLLSQRILNAILCLEMLALATFFIVSGIPNGFSALWICLIPVCAFPIFGISAASFVSLLALADLLFFFWLPFGRSLLQYEYTREFMLRYPIFYIVSILLSLIWEKSRADTQTALLESERRYKNLYCHDALTGMYNRYAFNEVLDAAVARGDTHSAAVFVLDIDDFKHINDVYGHDTGDVVLKGVADAITETLCDDCSCCRWGGEEFVTLFLCDHDPIASAERVRQRISQLEFSAGDAVFRITASIGVALCPSLMECSTDRLFSAADECLYEAKRSGKNRVIHRRLS